MEDRHISLPEQKNYERALAQAQQLALEKLAAIADIQGREDGDGQPAETDPASGRDSAGEGVRGCAGAD